MPSIKLVPKQTLLEVPANTPWSFVSTYFITVNDVKTAQDLTGYVLVATVTARNGKDQISLTVTPDPDQVTNPGKFTISCDETTAKQIGIAETRWRLMMTPPGGIETAKAWGPFTAKDTE